MLARLLWTDIEETDDIRRKKNPDYIPGRLRGAYGLEAFGYRLGCWKGDYAKVRADEAKEAGVDPKDKQAMADFVWGSWNPEMQSYCEQDVEVTARLWRKCLARWFDLALPEERRQPWSDECIELEHRVAEIVARQERHGFAFDVERAQAFYLDLIEARTGFERELKETFKPWFRPTGRKTVKQSRRLKMTEWTPIGTRVVNRGKPAERHEPIYPVALYEEGAVYTDIALTEFNPNSGDHIAARLTALFGWEPGEFTPSGKPKTGEDVMKELPWAEAQKLTEFLTVQKRIAALAEGKAAWMKKERNGRVHGSVNTGGACSGRMTHSDPNIAQVPGLVNKKTGEEMAYGRECRELFTSTAGYLLVGCDADALELRCLGGYMAVYDRGAYIEVILKGDKKLGTDMHSVNARALGLSGDNAREIAKKWFYAFIYGAGDYKLGTILGVTGKASEISSAGAASKKRFLANLPALGKLTREVKKRAKEKGFLKGLDGRRLYVRKAHAALNTLLQSAGAIIMKKALVILDEDLRALGLSPCGDGGEDYEFCANVHDEWQIDAKPEHAEAVGTAAAEAIRKAGDALNFRCPLAGNYECGNNWAETH